MFLSRTTQQQQLKPRGVSDCPQLNTTIPQQQQYKQQLLLQSNLKIFVFLLHRIYRRFQSFLVCNVVLIIKISLKLKIYKICTICLKNKTCLLLSAIFDYPILEGCCGHIP